MFSKKEKKTLWQVESERRKAIRDADDSPEGNEKALLRKLKEAYRDGLYPDIPIPEYINRDDGGMPARCAALVDIYGSVYPDIHKGNPELWIKKSKELVGCCGSRLPYTNTLNEILVEYLNNRDEERGRPKNSWMKTRHENRGYTQNELRKADQTAPCPRRGMW